MKAHDFRMWMITLAIFAGLFACPIIVMGLMYN